MLEYEKKVWERVRPVLATMRSDGLSEDDAFEVCVHLAVLLWRNLHGDKKATAMANYIRFAHQEQLNETTDDLLRRIEGG